MFRHICKNRLKATLDRACDAIGVARIRVHDLRHTRITYLLLQGVTPLYVCQQAGHHSPAFTLKQYGHLVAATPQQRRDWCNV
jgi:integrase